MTTEEHAMTEPSTNRPLVLALVGVGPRGAGLLERLVANAAVLGSGPVEVHLIDPFPAGGGRVWRSAQSELLRLNTTAEDLTAFVDHTVAMAGPVTPGPTLAEWCQTHGVDLDDRALAAEAASLGPLDFPTRRLASAYLDFAVRRALSPPPAGTTVLTHRQRAVDLRCGPRPDAKGDREVVVLENGETIEADAVVLLNSHVDVGPAPRFAALADFATEHGLTYLPPGYAGDLDLSAVPAGQDVLVRGFGLDFVDLMVLLTEGRGGRFVTRGDRLVYEPSGSEPHLLVGSRRGVPYHAKPTYRLRVPRPPGTTFCTPQAVSALLGRGETLHFFDDVWPLVGREVAWGYYRELGLGHPDRIATSWSDFAEGFAALEWGSEAYDRWIADAVPDHADRFDPAAVDRPLRQLRVADADELSTVVRRYVRADLARRADQRHSADLGAFFALLAVLPVLGPVLGSPQLDPRSLVADFYGWFLGFFSFWASGPPPDRLEQLLALEEAGVVSFLGPGLEVAADVERGVFVARSSAVAYEVEAHALVDATLPAFDLGRAEDPLLAALLARGEVSSHVLRDPAGRPLDTGQLRTDATHHLVRADGSVAPRRLALGMHTAVKAAAFARPCTNAPVHRLNDQVARALLALRHHPAEEAVGVPADDEPVGAGTRG
ncbi:FAD/NAD(P)-binding protein [uncultured Friedmanniella sp.]|uniref:FAD/NAD(P)-binding protein n=1 Tax=uncultured Friedmanniella sp. TaxID=335381 RepID=UPI0035CB7919